jgi:hypothetical protein
VTTKADQLAFAESQLNWKDNVPSNDDRRTKVTTDQQQETGPWDAALGQLKNPMKSTPIKARFSIRGIDHSTQGIIRLNRSSDLLREWLPFGMTFKDGRLVHLATISVPGRSNQAP